MAARSKLCRSFATSWFHPTPNLPPSSSSRRIAVPSAAIHRAFLHQSKAQRCDDSYTRCLESNKKWASSTSESDPSFFPTLSKAQSPSILWLGCADSRVPETTILGLKPGDVFTHRNIANICNPTDFSMLSVVQYAVAHVGVKHVVLCGHSSCGGVAASLANSKLDVLDVWLQPLRLLREELSDDLDKLDEAGRKDLLARANIRKGVQVLKHIPAVIDAQRDRGLQIHGVLYHLDTGVLEDVVVDESEADAKKRIDAADLK